MRELQEFKFRAWLKRSEMGYFGLLDVDNPNPLWSCPKMQFTGLCDKNGKEIYEGDILGGIFGGAFIAYCDKCKQFQISTNEDGCLCCLGEVQWREVVESGEDLEVIGNIYEHPHLLKEDTP